MMLQTVISIKLILKKIQIGSQSPRDLKNSLNQSQAKMLVK